MSSLKKLRPNEMEAANRGEVTALLIRLGYQIYRPEADVDGIDLVLKTPEGELICVQLKSRLVVNKPLYGERDIWMLFPECPWNSKMVRRWFLVPHDVLFPIMEERHGQAPKWAAVWSVAKPASEVLGYLGRFELG